MTLAEFKKGNFEPPNECPYWVWKKKFTTPVGKFGLNLVLSPGDEGEPDERMFELAEGLIAFDGEQAIGYAIFYPNFATFRGQRGLYLEDIYIRDTYRGKGVGEAMLREIARFAAERGYERLDLLVLDWNTPAVNFYKKLGAVRDDDERHFKFTDDAFKKLIA